MSNPNCEFWKVIGEAGELAWLGITRPGARSAIDRDKVWTLVPRSRVFIANWFVTDEFRGAQGGLYSFENIDVEEARDLVAELSDPSQDDIARLMRPERVLTAQQVDRVEAVKVLGRKAHDALGRR